MWGELTIPEGRSGKPPSRGKKYPAFRCKLNNLAISEEIFSRLPVVGLVIYSCKRQKINVIWCGLR